MKKCAYRATQREASSDIRDNAASAMPNPLAFVSVSIIAYSWCRLISATRLCHHVLQCWALRLRLFLQPYFRYIFNQKLNVCISDRARYGWDIANWRWMDGFGQTKRHSGTFEEAGASR